jgi:hypothetical protein
MSRYPSNDKSAPAWEDRNRIGLNILNKFGFNGRLGANEDGISRPIELSPVYDRSHIGIGYQSHQYSDRYRSSSRPLSAYRSIPLNELPELPHVPVDINRIYKYPSKRSVNDASVNLQTKSKIYVGQVGQDNLDDDTVDQLEGRGSTIAHSAEDSDSSDSDNSDAWDTEKAATFEPGECKSSFQIVYNDSPYRNAKQRNSARFKRFRQTGSWDKPLPVTKAVWSMPLTMSTSSKDTSTGASMRQLPEKRTSKGDEGVQDYVDSSMVLSRASSRARKPPDRYVATQSLVPDIVSNNDRRSRSPLNVEPFDDRVKIIKPRDPSENTCMFYAMYNSFRTQEERFAFSDGDLEYPSKAFVNFMSNKSPEIRHRIINEGYISQDMMQYLRELIARGRIREFDWIHKKNWAFTTFFCGGEQNQPAGSWLLFGLSVVSSEKKAISNRIKDAGENEDPRFVEITQAKEALSVSLDYCKKMPQYLKCPHGSVIQRVLDEERTTYYYDTAKRFVEKDPTIQDVTTSITAIHLAVQFEIYLHGDTREKRKRRANIKKNLRNIKKEKLNMAIDSHLKEIEDEDENENDN